LNKNTVWSCSSNDDWQTALLMSQLKVLNSLAFALSLMNLVLGQEENHIFQESLVDGLVAFEFNIIIIVNTYDIYVLV